MQKYQNMFVYKPLKKIKIKYIKKKTKRKYTMENIKFFLRINIGKTK